MAASSNRVYHQDYIARIRYSNGLPPPPNPPKLLNIPNTGLSSGQYTSAGFASRLAREQPLNIEADAELGMPINLVGLPGVFDGDESSIHGLEDPPVPHPHDRALLRPLSTLGKPNSVTSGVSFLRRTEYISSDQGRSRFESTTSKDLVRPRGDTRKRKRPDVADEEDPTYIMRAVVKGFDIAHPADTHTGSDSSSHVKGTKAVPEEFDAWNIPQHPTDEKLKVLESYPVLPDLDAFPDPGSYVVAKFITNPVTNSDVYDSRLDVGLLRPLQLSTEISGRLQEQKAAHEADPNLPEPGLPEFEYEFFLPEDTDTARAVQSSWNSRNSSYPDAEKTVHGSERDDMVFRYHRIRAYETYQQNGTANDLYGDIVALALHDGTIDGEYIATDRHLPRAAYFYPVSQRFFIRPRRMTNASMIGAVPAVKRDEGDKVDFLDVSIREPDVAESTQRQGHKDQYMAAVGWAD